ncbi:LysR family transcriptional regulator [Burkholderia anthina]|uniref:LysR family transcriptional regulator n=1 Tax=Burkholderia anthina TaxID=179879 RepID=A0A6P2GCX4_9BURK|nr:LysR family transcriptional regulator [Burkholderia anthina]MBM2771305.1 LysR family transcriptional regulator [Burkholderia anthina]VVU51610.1 LysR family transcriptional regulator [Burkholderia anthina]
MDIKHLQLFFDIVEAGSLSKVCASRGIAQSALSKHIAALENEIGAKLFYRTGRGVVLTELGQSMMPRVRSLLSEFELLASEVRDQSNVPSGPVRLALQSSITQHIVGPLFQHVRADFPKIDLRLMEGFAGNIEEALANGRADVGVFSRYGDRIHKTDEALVTDELYLIARTGDPVVGNPSCRFADVAGLPLVLPGAPDGFHMMLLDEAKKSGVHLNTQIEVDSLTAMREIVANGAAYTILTRQAVSVDMQLGRIQVSRITDPVLSRTLVLAVSTQRPLTHASRTVIGLIRKLTQRET